MGVILDTNFYLGLVHPKDTNAINAEKCLNMVLSGEYGQLFTTDLVITEAVTLTFSRTNGNQLILEDLKEMFWGENKLANTLETNLFQYSLIWEQFVKFNSDKKIKKGSKGKKEFLSFVDVSIIFLAKHYQIDYIISSDSHFDGFLIRI